MPKKHLLILSVLFDLVNNEIEVSYSNAETLRIVRQFYSYELVGGTDKMQELAKPIAEKYIDFLKGARL